MGNFSLSSLCLISLISASPLYSINSLIEFSSIFILRSHSPFLYQNRPASSISCSIFSQFINSAIRVDSDLITESQFSVFSNFTCKGDHLSIKSCVFRSCQNIKGGIGGAILYDSPSASISIIQCGFQGCHASTSAGALWISASSIKIIRVYIIECTSLVNLMAFSLNSPTESPNPTSIVIKAITVAHCGPQLPAGEEQIANAKSSDTQCLNTNFSCSEPMKTDGSVEFFDCSSLLLSYTEFYHNSGPGVLSLSKITNESSVEFCNFIANKAITAPLIEFLSSSMVIMRCFFAKNQFSKIAVFDSCENINFERCAFDFDQKLIDFTCYKCKFKQKYITQNEIDAENLADAFALIFSEKFTVSTSNSDETKAHRMTEKFTQTKNWYPMIYQIEQYGLFCLLGVSLPAFLLYVRLGSEEHREIKALESA